MQVQQAALPRDLSKRILSPQRVAKMVLEAS